MKMYEINRSLFILGGTGIGKSYAVEETGRKIAKKKGMEFSSNLEDSDKFRFIDFRLADKEPSDLRGIPDISGENVIWKTPEFLPKKGKGLLVLEEFNLAHSSLQAPAYQLVLDRKMDSYKVPDGFGIVAIGNRRKDRAHTYDLADPLKNRFFWAELDAPDTDSWVDWALHNDIDNRVISFVKANPNLLYKPPYMEEGETNRDNKTFPTPRGMEFTSDAIKGEPDKLIKFYASTTLGVPTATQFHQFIKLAEVIDFDELLKRPDRAELPTDLDKLYCLVSQLSSKFSSQKTKTKKKNYLEKICKIAVRLGAEYSRLLIRFLKQIDSKFVERELPRTDSFKDLADKQGKYILKEY